MLKQKFYDTHENNLSQKNELEAFPEPLSLYTHIPFCKAKCHYCDFISFENNENFENYTNSLINEICLKAPKYASFSVRTVFIGGGTPTILPTKMLKKIIDAVFANFNIENDVEITVEANPGTLSHEMLRVLKIIGVNRLSIGLQAVQNKLLRTIGRIHTVEEFTQNFRQARELGFDNINIDIMFALPTQTLEDWRQTLEFVVNLQPEHISAYGLIMEEGTKLSRAYANGHFSPCAETDELAMFDVARQILPDAGYSHYEISNFARDTYQCRHNLTYWHAEQYLGLGLAAHSFVGGRRFRNTENLAEYLTRQGTNKDYDEVSLTEKEAISEYMFMNLRLLNGVDVAVFKAKFGKDVLNIFGEEIAQLTKIGLLEADCEKIRLTKQGIYLSNQVFEKFL